jgi:hypothetical protein
MTVRHEPCRSCRMIGQYAPWAFLAVAAIISRLPVSPALHRGSAYLVVFALVLLVGSYVLKRIERAR